MNKYILFTLIINSHATGKLPTSYRFVSSLSFMLYTCYGETGVMDSGLYDQI